MITLPYQDASFHAVEVDYAWDGNELGCRGFAGVPEYDVNASSRYLCTSLSDIYEFGETQMKRIAKKPAHFWIWTTDLFEYECLDLIRRWGLEKKRTHIWVKTTEDFHPGLKGLEGYSADQTALMSEMCRAVGIPGKPNPKTGYWGKVGHELLILATNDKSFRTLNATREPSVFFAPVPNGEHSAKPEAAYELIRRNSPGPRVSLFQRTPREGFECWGNQLDERRTSTSPVKQSLTTEPFTPSGQQLLFPGVAV